MYYLILSTGAVGTYFVPQLLVLHPQGNIIDEIFADGHNSAVNSVFYFSINAYIKWADSLVDLVICLLIIFAT